MNDIFAFTENTKFDFLKISGYQNSKGRVEVRPDFVVRKSKDLMIRGGDFYSIWDEEKGFWSTDEDDVSRMIDSEMRRVIKEKKNDESYNSLFIPHYMSSSRSGSIDEWHKYCKQQMRDNFHSLDEKLIFTNMKVKKDDYVSKTLNYPLEKGDYPAYERLMSVLYSPDERHKLEWAIGAIVTGDSKKIQKFVVLYGPPKSGKSTVLNIIAKLFQGYTETFDAKVLGSASAQFALEAFRSNPLVAIQQDGDLSRIEDNARLNSLVSHEPMMINVKNKSAYTDAFHTFLFIGTNKPVKITDAKSGLLRRLIDVEPSGNRVPPTEYRRLIDQIDFELGAIAWHCKEVYLSDPNAYDDYTPLAMMGATNDFYNFMLDSYLIFAKQDGTTMKAAWEMYKQYCDEARVPYPLSQKVFKTELAEYFESYDDRPTLDDGSRPRSWYGGFKKSKFEPETKKKVPEGQVGWLIFRKIKSVFDEVCADMAAQYANDNGTPCSKWSEVTTKLSDIDTSQLHYVRIPLNHIVIDFDIPDENGNKCLEKNLDAASKWPPTYAELSKSGQGIHLHYIYAGNPALLSNTYAEHIEIKVFRGNSALRRKLSKCNDLKIATISSGLPQKEEKMVSVKSIQSVKALREQVIRNLHKEIHPSTKSSVDFIWKILEDAYNSDLKYDISDMRTAVLNFAMQSTNQAQACIKKVADMKFCSKDVSENKDDSEAQIVFYDVEVFPNLFLVNWKFRGTQNVTRWINPTPAQIEELLKYRLIGFNCRRYDNHMLYACLIGYSNEQIYKLSQKIINDGEGFFKEAYNLSYTDVYDFASTKQFLKKWEIQLGIHHLELGLPWDQPVPEELWPKVAEYCDNDVIATEAVFDACLGDFAGRKILADLSGLTVNDPNRLHITKILIGNKENADHVYTDLAEIFPGYEFVQDENSKWHNMYRGTDVGFGGYVYAEPGMYRNVALLDVGNMHGASIIALNKFGSDTKNYIEIRNARMAIKHGIATGDFSEAKKMLGGRLAPYLDTLENAEALQNALKLVLNSTYGIAAATFSNPLKDDRDHNNIIALRGALFMRTLQDEVTAKGFTVAHIKTDSIKIPDATPEIIKFVQDFAAEYGYEMEHEATYDRMCLVNDAVYIAKYDEFGVRNKGGKKANKWTATGTQFQVPYVFKTLFSHEPIEFGDLCETKSVSKGNIVIDMDESVPDGEHDYVFVGRVGLFCPIKPGHGGGKLYREQNGKYYAVTGTKGYQWLEAEMVQRENKQDDVDRSYYDELCSKAVQAINEYGSFEEFAGSDWPPKDELPY